MNTRSNKTKSRSCPTRGMDENLSFRLSFSGAFEHVRITSHQQCRLEKNQMLTHVMFPLIMNLAVMCIKLNFLASLIFTVTTFDQLRFMNDRFWSTPRVGQLTCFRADPTALM